MHFTIKQFYRPLYKKLLKLKENTLIKNKIIKFNNLK